MVYLVIRSHSSKRGGSTPLLSGMTAAQEKLMEKMGKVDSQVFISLMYLR
jgi:hypothetical protein